MYAICIFMYAIRIFMYAIRIDTANEEVVRLAVILLYRASGSGTVVVYKYRSRPQCQSDRVPRASRMHLMICTCIVMFVCLINVFKKPCISL